MYNLFNAFINPLHMQALHTAIGCGFGAAGTFF
jgi:hypothetical protein